MKPLLGLEPFYGLCGLLFTAVVVQIARDRSRPRRWGSALFWALMAVVFLFGSWLPPIVSGYLVLAMVGLAATKQVGSPVAAVAGLAQRVAEAKRLGNRLLWPALLVPAIAFVGSQVLRRVQFASTPLVAAPQAAPISLGIGAVVALIVAWRVIGARRAVVATEGARIIDAIGWALILPQLLAALGGIFQETGVGHVVAGIATRALPAQFPLVAVVTYCLGMAIFTVCMGNAFAAFPVITAGVGLPLIVQQHHGNPAIMAAIGMLSGYCGTLMTPMAANFNVVPVMLLELEDKNAVIKAQLPIALTLLAANIALMYACVYRF